jgi:phage terminase large subunit-like protein
MVWAPERQFAEEVIEEVAAFPYGDHDDLVDSMSQAIIRFRQGDFLRLESDWVEDTRIKKTYKYY